MAFKMSNAQVFWRDEDEASGRRKVGLRDGDTTVFATLWPTDRDKQPNPIYDSAWAEMRKGATVSEATISYYSQTKGKGKGSVTYHNFSLIDFKS